MKNNNAKQYDLEYDLEYFNLDDLQYSLELEVEEHFSDLENINIDLNNIGNPKILKDAISSIVWEQFINQIGIKEGLDAKEVIDKTDYAQVTMDNARKSSGDFVDKILINRAINKNEKVLISKEDVRISVDKDSRFINYKEKIKAERLANNSKITDDYTGNIIVGNEQHNVDHATSVNNIQNDRARKFACIETKDLANQTENFAVTNENLNKSKGASTNQEYLNKRAIREVDLKNNFESTVDKINNQPISESEKRHNIEKARKAYQNKIDAKDDLMLEKQRISENKINKDIKTKISNSTQGKVLKIKEQGKTIAKSSFKAVLMGLLAKLLKKIIQKLIEWFTKGKKSFSAFIENIKESIKEFISNIKQHLLDSTDGFLTSVASAIFGPIVSVFKKTWMLLKQGYKSVKEAIDYIKKPENKSKSLSVLMLEVGKIVTVGLVAGGALILGEVIEKSLLSIPGFGFPIPLLGSLASILGLFFGAIVSGIIGAIALNIIDKTIAKKKKSLLIKSKIEKGNQILVVQNKLQQVVKGNMEQAKNQVAINIHDRHSDINKRFEALLEKNESIEIGKTKNDNDIDELFDLLNQ